MREKTEHLFKFLFGAGTGPDRMPLWGRLVQGHLVNVPGNLRVRKRAHAVETDGLDTQPGYPYFSFPCFCGSTGRTSFNIKDGFMSKEYDPRMHTAEHTLSGVLIRHYGCPRCFSTHINANKSKVDFHFPHDLSPEEVKSLTEEVNRELARDLPVVARDMPRDEAARKFNLSRLPESAGDTLRIVYIGDPDSPEGALDACPCIGEHVSHTAECGTFVWVSHEWKPDDGVLRIRFKLEH